MSTLIVPSRRLFLAASALPLFTVRGAFANLLDDLTKTPAQTEGPFYPDKLPLDTDNDLLVINDALTPGVGEITHLTGRVLDIKGNPVRNAVVEIWQCDGKGVYLHSLDSKPKAAQQDKNFQGFGRFATGSKGEYYFRTIKPVPYPGRTPHIHVMVKKGGKKLLTTQFYVKDHPGNTKDFVYTGVKDEKQRAAITCAFTPMKESKIGELVAHCDIVLGVSPES